MGKGSCTPAGLTTEPTERTYAYVRPTSDSPAGSADQLVTVAATVVLGGDGSCCGIGVEMPGLSGFVPAVSVGLGEPAGTLVVSIAGVEGNG
jgi:hypothetical protein